ncbi:hypothetical protein GCM10009000_023760 [Halobacterium noricense]
MLDQPCGGDDERELREAEGALDGLARVGDPGRREDAREHGVEDFVEGAARHGERALAVEAVLEGELRLPTRLGDGHALGVVGELIGGLVGEQPFRAVDQRAGRGDEQFVVPAEVDAGDGVLIAQLSPDQFRQTHTSVSPAPWLKPGGYAGRAAERRRPEASHARGAAAVWFGVAHRFAMGSFKSATARRPREPGWLSWT